MKLHFDPLGGIAGDMMLAALIDAFPEVREPAEAAMRSAGLPAGWRVETTRGRRRGFAGTHLAVVAADGGGPPSGRFAEIRARLEGVDLTPGVRERAIDIFRRLAEAEAAVHGVAVDDVHFHEIADWDSVADIVGAAAVLEALGVSGCSVSALPLGGGTVMTRHGPVPVPAPATARLLAGFETIDDGVPGERVTPTGAALLAHLRATPRERVAGTVVATGIGLGTRDTEGVANILRVIAFADDDPADAAADTVADTVAVIEFEVDDQTGEDLAVALDRLRAVEGVLDVVQAPVLAKKGRMAVAVRVLARPERRQAAIEGCFLETATIGLRWRLDRRVLLSRTEAERAGIRVKTARRPDGTPTAKAEMDDLAARGDTRANRERLRRRAEDRDH